MTKLKDVIDFISADTASISLFGCENGFSEDFYRRYQNVGRAFAKEHGMEFGSPELATIPEDTPLGEESAALFQELKKFAAMPE